MIVSLWAAGSVHGQPAPQLNLARGQPVTASGPTWSGLAVSTLTDGNNATFTHPLAATGTRGYYFEVDLGRSHSLERIALRNRADGCCPERLTRYRVEVYEDLEGDHGPLNWSAEMRSDNSFPPTGGMDTLTSGLNPAGLFQGRFVRVVNNSGAAYNPQIAEIEVYGGIPPSIVSFAADSDTLAPGESTTLRWTISGASGVMLLPGFGTIPHNNGSQRITPSATTTYTLTATNAGGAATSSISIGVGVTLQPPRISEFMAANAGGLKDSDGESPDWIELHNPNSFGLNIDGYFLTDSAKNPRMWRLPAVRIPALGYFVLFASGKNRIDPLDLWHANFKLSASGGYLGLIDRDGLTVIQQFPATYPVPKNFPVQWENVSFGQASDGSIGFMRPATPGKPNGQAYFGVVAAPTINAERGFYDAPITVALSSKTPDAIVRFTTNRTAPTMASGSTYKSPFVVANNTVLRVAAFREGWAPSPVDTHTYIFPDKVVAAPVMNTAITRNASYANAIRPGLLDVPSMSLATDRTINGTTETLASIEWLDPAGANGFQAECGARLYGGAFTDFAKKNFRLYFRPEYGVPRVKGEIFKGRDKTYPAVDEFDQLELRGGSHDMSQRGFYMSNLFTDDTLLEMGHLNPHGRFVHLYLNGSYWGLYHLRERWGAAMHRRYLGGAREDYESINGNWNVGGWPDPGVPYDGDGSTWTRIKGLRGNYAAVKAWLDVPQYVDYMLMWMFGGSEDEYRCVGPTVPGSGFKFVLNDADGWFCGPWYCAANNRTTRGAPGRSAGDGPGSIFSMLLKEGNSDYKMLLADRIHAALFREGALTPERNKARLQGACDEINRAFLAEAARWNYLSPSAWAGRRDYALTNWLPRRTAEVLTQWRSAGFYPAIDAPALNHPGGRVPRGYIARFQPLPRGKILFTLDGSDPRLPGGAVSPGAQPYESGGSFEINKNTILKSRTRDGALWSALNETFFQVEESPVSPGDIAISELHFASTRTNRVGSDFLELLNVSQRAVNLRGTRFSEGIDFGFPDNRDTLLLPGQRLVLVKDLHRFYRAHTNSGAPAGIYRGTLEPAGERLTLRAPDGSMVASFAFAASDPWPGAGRERPFSMVLAHPVRGLGNPAAWRSGAEPMGTPGTSDATIFSGSASADSDHDGLPAIVEYALGTRDDDASSGPESIIFEWDSGHRFVVRIPRRLRADDVMFRVDASLDLVSWFPAALLGTQPTDSDIAIETWGFDSGAAASAFLKVTVIRF